MLHDGAWRAPSLRAWMSLPHAGTQVTNLCHTRLRHLCHTKLRHLCYAGSQHPFCAVCTMGLSRAELDRLAEDILADRVIVGNVYCSRCGYNLRTLSFTGRCPECGGEYNARPLKMDGIFDVRLVEFPAGDVFAAIFTLGLGGWLTLTGIVPLAQWSLFFGLVFLVMGGFFARSAWTRTARFFFCRGVIRRIESGLDE